MQLLRFADRTGTQTYPIQRPSATRSQQWRYPCICASSCTPPDLKPIRRCCDEVARSVGLNPLDSATTRRDRSWACRGTRPVPVLTAVLASGAQQPIARNWSAAGSCQQLVPPSQQGMISIARAGPTR